MTDFKLFCFDLDGTLIANHLREDDDGKLVPVDEGFDHIEILPNVPQQLADRVWLDDKAFAVVTNQGGVATGWQTEDQVYRKAEKVWKDLQIGQLGGPRSSFHVAFDYPKGPEPYASLPPRRKPNPTMLHEAMTLHHARPDETLFVGDLPTDEEAAVAAGVEYMHPAVFFGWEGYE
jgi:histidinol phosphatase-like enzyme